MIDRLKIWLVSMLLPSNFEVVPVRIKQYKCVTLNRNEYFYKKR